MLITEKKLRRVIRDLLREQEGATEEEKRDAALKGKSIRQAKKNIRKSDMSPERKKEVKRILTLLKKVPKKMRKLGKIDEKRAKKWQAASQAGWAAAAAAEKVEEAREKGEDVDDAEVEKLYSGFIKANKKLERMQDKLDKLLKKQEADWEDVDFKTADVVFNILMEIQHGPQSASVTEPDEYAERDAAQAKRAEEEKKRTDKTAPLGTEFDIGEDWTYKITDSDRVKIQDTGDLHFTVASGPSNVDKSYKLTAKDKNHKIVQKVKRLHPHLIDSLNF
jgi:hypothetical protein